MNENITIRTFRPEDLQAWAALVNDVDAYDRQERATTLEELERDITSPGYYPETDCFMAWDSSQLVAYADLFLRKGDEQSFVYTWGLVRPEWRRRGLGMRLMNVLYRRAEQRMDEVPAGAVYFHAGTMHTEKDRQALFAAFGMQPVRYYVNMARPLNGNLPPVEVPTGYCLRPFDRARDVEPVWRVVESAFRDHWGFGPYPLDEFIHDRIDAPHFRPELVLVAEEEATGNMAGCCLNKIDPDWIARTGRKEGYVGTLAVLREARQHGLGTALMVQTMHIMRQQGMEGIHLHADAENLTGAVRIYERLGFAVRKNSIAYRKVMRAP